ncbi:MAG: DNA internalization-related competence protein ComEC/Rec2 [Mogibacterium sp.]|nr:DNA internalization-related competence protein ComEC/Rec2 [Mogibacterium sp.]
MIRRKLTAYTYMMIAGIAAGYFLTERIRFIPAVLFLLAVGVGIAVFDEISTREKRLCLAMLALGFLLFTSHFVYYESAARSAYGFRSSDYTNEEGEEKRYTTNEEEGAKRYTANEEEGAKRYTGRIITFEDRGDYLRLTLRLDEDERGRGYKVIADVKQYENESGNEKLKDDRNGSREEGIEYIGAKASISGKLAEFSEADNPGCFDYRDYMRSKGIAFKIKGYDLIIEDEEVSFLWRLKRRLAYAREHFLRHFEEEIGGFLRGIIFGDKSEIDDDVLREFKLNSTGHILAVSGLHIGFLHSLLRFLSARKKTWLASILIISILLIYGEMTMWSSSVVRAIMVLGMSILSVNLRRRFDLLSSISAAAFLILLFEPYMLLNAGFQLSFAAMSGIAFFSEPLSRYFGKLLGVIFSVQIGTVPVIATTFHRINLISFLINIPIIALSSILVPICIFCLFLDILAGGVPKIAVSFVELAAESIININHSLSFDGFFSELTSGGGSAWTISLMLVLFFCSSEWFRVRIVRRKWRIIGKTLLCFIIPIIMVHAALFDPFFNDEIVFLSVGQGDCTHIRYGKEDIFIDGGGSDFSNVGENILMPYLLSHRAGDLEMAVLTHLHKDHYLGIEELSEIYPVRSVAIPEDYEEYYKSLAAFNCNNILYLNHKSNIRIGDDIEIEVLFPYEGIGRKLIADDANEHNMVYMIHYRGVKIMVTGDLLEEDEFKMLRKYRGTDKLKCDILKVAHHGSKSSSSEEFLDAASPEIAVIQVGRNNLYGHPHEQTLERLKARGIQIYRTDEDGAVGVDIGKGKKRLSVHKMH